MVVVALGEPGTPLICWASTGKAATRKNRDAAASLSRPRLGSSFGAFIGVFCRLSVEWCKTEISGRRKFTSLKLGHARHAIGLWSQTIDADRILEESSMIRIASKNQHL